MTSFNGLEIIGWFACVLFGLNLVAMALFVLFAKLPNGKFREMIRGIIFQLDKFADKLENSQKRAVAMAQISGILGWRGIFIPTILIGWVIDTEAAAIKESQKVTGTPDLPNDQEFDDRVKNNMRQVTLAEIKQMAFAAKTALQQSAQRYEWPIKVYLHWSAGHYDQFFTDYHFNIGADGSVFVSTNDLSEKKSHTYFRNSGAIGVAAACAYNAVSCNDLGPEPPTALQIEAMAQVVAVLSKSLDIPIDIQHFMTHAEAADNMDGCDPGYEANGYPEGRYGPQNSVERWDLWVVKAGEKPGSGGDMLRGKGVWYQQNGVG
ncbi:peptidoglycan recognition protein family protein [Sporomusa malonica]|uniref:N-acetylmuramoyl-L-alanine amidase n=1 Tax=Sporomusa malonica TaxID=112901 RepID=A0A1W2E154_9FIRM|nr:N-acetylmuramoyl-L-alanine amidase [Sporomusa malonica]SMD03122.1 N-acetylmuramoyl-L-alanine amidase [Sporomusa malonica]